MTENKRHYIPPKVIRQPAETAYLDFLKHENKTDRLISSNWGSNPEYVTIVDFDRRYIEVSTDFCKLLGYERDELLGKKYDAVTAPSTNNIETVFTLFEKLGYMHGLWMLISRQGTRILVRYECWIRPDNLIEGHMEVVGAGY